MLFALRGKYPAFAWLLKHAKEVYKLQIVSLKGWQLLHSAQLDVEKSKVALKGDFVLYCRE